MGLFCSSIRLYVRPETLTFEVFTKLTSKMRYGTEKTIWGQKVKGQGHGGI